ncbi:BUD13 homolog isoform X2 [Myzus persicae]|uniref:BUD13 homolog isoform X2 n=1 Tax=Myzus persicae TaxID=13164 RepID=UPI000B933CD7|nr:BUD13 homolog isoform X2 [Myzus persicae]
MSLKETQKKEISQKDYLKRYLSSGKKKIEKRKIPKRVQIIDDNIDCIENDCENNIGFDPVDEFAPQIVVIFNERPKDIKILNMYKNKKWWKRIGGDCDIEEDSTKIDIDQVNNNVQQEN